MQHSQAQIESEAQCISENWKELTKMGKNFLTHNFTLPHTDFNPYKNSFINRCLFQFL